MAFGSAYTVFASALTRHAGGILCVVRTAYIEKLDNVTWEIVLPGRVATLTLVRGAFTRRLVFVHLTPANSHSWQFMCDLALSEVRHDCLSLLIGDVNVCSALGDSVCSISGEPKANFGSRTYYWRSATLRLSDIPSGLTHINKAKHLFSRIDRCLVNLPSDLLASTHAHGVVMGGTEPPLGSDHWPVRFLVVHDIDADHSGLPQWPLHHPDFPNLMEFHRAVHGLRVQSSFADGYADLLTIVESATRDLQASRKLLPDTPRCNIPALMQYLHAVYRGDEDSMLTLSRRAPHWALTVSLTLADRAKRAAALLERATRDADVDDSITEEFDISQRHKTNWAQLAFSTWQRHCAVEAVTVASAHRILSTDRDEAHAIREHWSHIYGARDSPHPPSDVLAFTVPFLWDQVSLDAQHIAGALHHARVRSAPGPDGLAVGHLKLLEPDVVSLLQLALDECMQHDVWPACFQDAVHVFLPKVCRPTVQCSELRPIALKNSLAKLLPAVYAHQLGQQAQERLTPCQFGGIPGRTIGDAYLALEKAALFVAQHYPEASILSVDLKTAFPSIRRSWCLSVLRASGARERDLQFFRCLLQGNCISIRWKRRYWRGYEASTGLLQGCTASAILFVLSLDPWLRYISWRLPSQLSGLDLLPFLAFFDDGTVITAHLSELRIWQHAFALLDSVLGLGLNCHKCHLIPIGAMDVSEFTARFTHFDVLQDVCIVDSCRWLGVCIGRGVFQPHAFMIERMSQRLEKLRPMAGGSAMNAFVGRSVLLSIPRHTMRLCNLDAALQAKWHECWGVLIPGWRNFLGQTLPRLKELFGLPCALPLAAQVALESQLGQLEHLRFDPRVLKRQLEDEMGAYAVSHPLQGWRVNGCLASWCNTLELATRLGIMRVRHCSGAVRFVNTTSWTAVKRALTDHTTVTKAHALRFFTAKLHRELASENAARHYFSDKFLRQIMVTGARISKFAPAKCIALLRTLFMGHRSPSVHRHAGNCCLCATLHTGSLFAPVLRGCFRRPFSRIRALQFLEGSSPDILLQLIVVGSASDPMDVDCKRAVTRLGNLCMLISELRHSCLHARKVECHGTHFTPEAAWRVLRARQRS
eukprot:200354-Amphidinium_carterae.5